MAEYPATFTQGFSEAKFDELIQSNLKTSLLMTQKACEYFKVRKRGRIVYLLQELHRAGFEGDAISGLTRLSLVSFARSLAREFVQDQVTVNCVAVGPTEEYLLQKLPGAKSLQTAHQELFKANPGVKISDPNEVANVVAFLASPLASGVTGQCISAAGALSLLA
jgi:3-oxoacyl-[acyl-carrier protein] reductase